MKKIIMLIISFIVLTAIGCTPATVKTSNKLVIAVSIVPEQTFVQAVAGNLADVITIIPPGKSPTNYAPTPGQMEKLSQAKIYFSIGVPTEKANILPKLKDINPTIKLVSLNEAAAKTYSEREFAPGSRDPHIWLSPKRAQIMVASIAHTLSSVDPKNKETYKKNAEKYINQLKELDSNIKASLKNSTQRTIIVYHPAFGYFADDYGLEMLSLENEGKPASAKDFENIITLAKKQNIRIVFYQAEIDGSQAKTLASEIGGNTIQITPLAPDYISNLAKTAKIFQENLQR